MGALSRPAQYCFAFILIAGGLCLCAAQAPQTASENSSTSLFAQAAAQSLDREFSQSAISYLLLDAHSGGILAAHWDNYESPIPLGSLVKPFTALAYAQGHALSYPVYECRGKASGCWQVRPHGKIGITSAVALSCNSYFLSLAQHVTPQAINGISDAFGLEPPDEAFPSVALVGIGSQWRISPLHLSRAYLELYRRRNQPGVAELLQGMRQSAESGTGAAVGQALKHSNALVKTGTAPCTHHPTAPADGFVVAFYPAQQPEILLMIRVHGVAGAKAAEIAGQILSQMEP